MEIPGALQIPCKMETNNFSYFFYYNSSIYSWPRPLERERGGVGGDATTDGVPASVAKLSLLKPSLSGGQPAAGPLQRGWWGFGDFGVGEGKRDGAELLLWPFPPGSASLSSSGDCQSPLDSFSWFKVRLFPPRSCCKSFFKKPSVASL